MNKKYVLSIVVLTFLTFPSQASVLWQASAGENKVHVVELYTSQGCHSCPPAETLMNSLVGDSKLWKEVIPLAFHVDYWNYLGWKDPFSKSKYSQRQRLHNVLRNTRSVYTPGWIVDGREWRGFFAKEGIPRKATLKKTVPLQVLLTHDNQLNIRIPYVTEALPEKGKPMVISVAILGSGYQSYVNAGENSGKKLLSNFVVLQFSQYRVSSDTSWSIPLNKIREPRPSNKTSLAVLLSDDNLKPIQAVGNWIDKSLVLQ